MKRSFMFSIVVGIVVFAVIVANLLSSLVAPFYWGPFNLSAGFYVFPLLFISSDLIQRCYGWRASRQTALVATVSNLLMIVAIEIAYYLIPGGKEALAPLHVSALIITIAGLGSAYVSDFVNDATYRLLTKVSNSFFVHAIGSSVVGQIVDSLLFVFGGLFIVYHLPVKAAFINAGSQVLFKLLVETALFPFTAWMARKIGRDEYEEAKSWSVLG